MVQLLQERKEKKMIDYKFKPSTEEKCLIETLIERVIHCNQDGGIFWEASLNIGRSGVQLSVKGCTIGSLDWTMRSGCNYIASYACEKEHVEHMLEWLDEQYAIEHKEEEDPRIEAQRELDKEQI